MNWVLAKVVDDRLKEQVPGGVFPGGGKKASKG